MNYTYDKNQIVFLKDADIISAFNEKNVGNEVVLSNGIPSYELFKKTYDELSTYDNNICAYLKDYVDISVDNLSAFLKNTILSVYGISCRVNELCTELSTAIDDLSTSLSTTTKLSIEQLCAEIIANDKDISAISAYLSNDVMHYKGDLVFAAGDQLLKTIFGRTVKTDKYKFLDGFVYRAPSDCVVLESSEPGARQIEFEENDYLIFKQDVELTELTFNSFVLIKDYDNEIKRTYDKLSSEINTISTAILLSVDGLSNYVDVLELSVNGLSVRTSEICSELSIAHNNLSSALSDEIIKLSTALSTNIDALSANLSNEIEKLSASLSTTTNLSIEQLCSEIIANDKDISAISTDLSVLEYHYNRTFDEKVYKEAAVGPDLSVDVLKIVNSENTNEFYTL